MADLPSPRLYPVGEAALAVAFGEGINPDTNRLVHAFVKAAALRPLSGIGELVPAYTNVLVHFDPLQLDSAQVLAWAKAVLPDMEGGFQSEGQPHVIPVVYGGEYGPDLPELAAACGMSETDVVRLHTGHEYQVYLIGFTPGFPYLGSVDARIAAPRRSEPRLRVPAGSVGIAGAQTGIYPVDSPGGWQIIGYSPVRLFDPLANPPSLLSPGDRVRFVAIRPEELPDGD